MPEGRRGAGGLALGLWLVSGAAVQAAEPEGFAARIQRALEMPAHRLLMATLGEGPRQPAPFVTDGCSGGMSAIWAIVSELFPAFAGSHGALPPWEGCCVTHDRAYHDAGGARDAGESYDARLVADEALRLCVRQTGRERAPGIAAHYGLSEAEVEAAYGMIADAMFEAVRAGGGPCTGLPWRWGYGFPQCLLPVR